MVSYHSNRQKVVPGVALSLCLMLKLQMIKMHTTYVCPLLAMLKPSPALTAMTHDMLNVNS